MSAAQLISPVQLNSKSEENAWLFLSLSKTPEMCLQTTRLICRAGISDTLKKIIYIIYVCVLHLRYLHAYMQVTISGCSSMSFACFTPLFPFSFESLTTFSRIQGRQFKIDTFSSSESMHGFLHQHFLVPWYPIYQGTPTSNTKHYNPMALNIS